VSRRAFEEANGFDEAFFMYAEEKDLCARLGRLGWQTYLVPGAAIVHIGEQSTGRVPHRRYNEFRRSQRHYLRKHLGPGAARIVPLFAALGDTQLWLAAATLSRLPPSLRPARMRSEAAEEYRRQARGLIAREDRGGLRELADEWNVRQAAPHVEDGWSPP
jgi:GT2 family glycosyltransferase